MAVEARGAEGREGSSFFEAHKSIATEWEAYASANDGHAEGWFNGLAIDVSAELRDGTKIHVSRRNRDRQWETLRPLPPYIDWTTIHSRSANTHQFLVQRRGWLNRWWPGTEILDELEGRYVVRGESDAVKRLLAPPGVCTQLLEADLHTMKQETGGALD